MPEVRLTQVFLTSCHTLFYGSSRKSTREQLVELTTGLVANIDPLSAILDTTQFYTNFKAAYNRLSPAHSRAADVGGPRGGRPGVRGRGRGRGRGPPGGRAPVNQVAAPAGDDNPYEDCSDG